MMPTVVPLYHVNAFTSAEARGNPAAVVLVHHEPEETFYATTARDLNLPATAFLVSLSEGGYAIRWFTPTRELPVCGHATLAAATVLFAQSQADTLEFTSTSATLTAERTPDRGVALTFPLTSTKPSELAYARVAPLAAAALSCAVGDVLAVAEFDRGPGCTGVVVEISADVDLEHAVLHLSHFKRRDTHMAIVTQAVGGGEGTLAVRSRVFVPFVGVDEDPVTGSAHTALLDYYLLHSSARHAALAGVDVDHLPGVELHARQVSLRGGEMRCDIFEGRARIVGRGVVWGRGVLELEL